MATARTINTMHPTDNVPMPADSNIVFLMTGGSSAQAADWNTSTGAVANAGTAGIHLVRVSGCTTAGAAFLFTFNCMSTAAAVPTSGYTVSATTRGIDTLIATGPSAFQIPGTSTGFSVAAVTSGNIMIEMWRK